MPCSVLALLALAALAEAPRASQAAEVVPQLRQALADRQGPLPVWVFFRDGGAIGPELEAELEAALHPRTLERRRLRRSAPGLVDGRDLPLPRARVEAVLATGARLRTECPWISAVSVEADAGQVEAIAALPCVAKLQPVNAFRTARAGTAAAPLPLVGDFYGVSRPQLEQLNLTLLHDRGFSGEGVVVGVLDTGFRRTHDAYVYPGHELDVVAEHDFVDGDGNTAPEPGDLPNQHEHGTLVLGTIAAYEPETIVGGAYDASVVLAKVEDLAGEYPLEEDYFVAGLAFIEANGGDVATSSLIITGIYGPDALDGMTSVMTLGFNAATENGLHCFQGAGNAGHDADPATNHLELPADAFQVVTVGAVDSSGTTAWFSSDGPTLDGRVKPEVLARGLDVHTTSPTSDGATVTASGTSLSTPLVAAVAACLVEAHPDWTVDQMRAALAHTASGYVASGTHDPLFVRGYGIVDADAAEGRTDPLLYCDAERNSGGCSPMLFFDGLPSASSPEPFELRATLVVNHQPGLFFFGTSGPAALPFQGGTLCVAPPQVRTPPRESGGNAGPTDCSGGFAIELNALIQSGAHPALVAGASVNGQFWYRDPADPSGTGTTAAIAFTIRP